MKVQNIKVGFRFEPQLTKSEIIAKLSQSDPKIYHNFLVLRDNFVFTIFWTGCYINITKISDLDNIKLAASQITKKLEVSYKEIFVHNICLSGSIDKKVPLRQLSFDLKRHYRTSFNTHFFPALFLRKNEEPTIILFQNGKYSIIGAKSKIQAEKSFEYLKNVLASNYNYDLS